MNEHPRRTFIQAASAAGVAAMFARGAQAAADDENPTITLISGWQTVNIGDIAHTPGVLDILARHVPQAKIILWPGGKLDRDVVPLLKRNYPALHITSDVDEIYERTDLLIHGSGPGVIRADRLVAWHRKTGKPYGILGVTVSDPKACFEALEHARFVFTRETHSLERIKRASIGEKGPEVGFMPDGTFALSMRDDASADRFLALHGLEAGKFICVVPRLRYTPYHKIRGITDPKALEEWHRKDAHNERFAEQDHAKARAAIIRWVRETGGKVLLAPEMTYQLEIMRPLLVDPLPEDVRRNVIRRETYWMPDEAASTYARARAVLSFECHSPIIAAAVGTPAFYLRQPEDTIKGQMFYDVGLKDWVFEIDETTGEQVAARLMEVHGDYPAAKRYLAKAMKGVDQRIDEAMKAVGNAINKPR